MGNGSAGRAAGVAVVSAAWLLVTSCGSGEGPVTAALLPGTQDTAQVGHIAARDGVVQGALGIWELRIDPQALTASAAWHAGRTAAATDDLFLLSVDAMLSARSFQLTGVTGTDTTVDVHYTVTHPFPAPLNPAGTPNGSTNRADLGFTGMTVFLASVQTATGNLWFTDRCANTRLIANADAYWSPGLLLSLSTVANTFPYRLLVDELAGGTGSRVDVSNGSNVFGNYGTDGWTRAELGAGNKQWTGYGVLHQGQTSANTVSLNKAALGPGYSLKVAIIAKYNDPRGGTTTQQKNANRLPPATPNPALFAYRMPHGALDVAAIEYLGESGGFAADTITASTLRFRVQDWDARSPETTEPDLSLDPVLTNVAVGESGMPVLDVSIPGVLGDASATASLGDVVDDDSAYGGDTAEDSGRPGDGLFFSALVTKNAGSGQSTGTFTGMVRVVDPEEGLTIGLNENLTPVPSLPSPTTYQIFTVEQAGGNTAPTGSYLVLTPTIVSGNAVTIAVQSVVDPDADAIDIEVDWDNDGTYTTAATINSPYPSNNPLTAPITYTFSGSSPDLRQVPVRLNDGTVTVNLLPLASFEVLAPAPVFATYNVPLPECSAGFTDVQVLIDVDSRPMLIYRDACTDMLMFARPNTSNPDGPEDWPSGSIYPIDPATGKGKFSSATLNLALLPIVSYYDETNGNMKVAIGQNRRPAGTSEWWRTTPDSSQNVGIYTGVVVLPSGRIGVAHKRVTDGDLRVAFSSRNNPQVTADWPASQKYTLVEGGLPSPNAGNHISATVVNGMMTIVAVEQNDFSNRLVAYQSQPIAPPATVPSIEMWTEIDLSGVSGGGADLADTEVVEAFNSLLIGYHFGGMHQVIVSPSGNLAKFDMYLDTPQPFMSGSAISAVGECTSMHVVVDNPATNELSIWRTGSYPPAGPSPSNWGQYPLGTMASQIDCGCAAGKLFIARPAGRNVVASLAASPW